MNGYVVVLASRSGKLTEGNVDISLAMKAFHQVWDTESCLICYSQVYGKILFIIFSVCFLLHGMVEWLACLLCIWKVPSSIHGPEAGCVDVSLHQVTAACFQIPVYLPFAVIICRWSRLLCSEWGACDDVIFLGNVDVVSILLMLTLSCLWQRGLPTL
jgi:hypothetical protein